MREKSSTFLANEKSSLETRPRRRWRETEKKEKLNQKKIYKNFSSLNKVIANLGAYFSTPALSVACPKDFATQISRNLFRL
jgi:hypothetical protein